MVERARFAMTDGVGDAFLDAAIESEIDRLAVRIGQLADGDGDMRVGMTALEAGNELVEELDELHAAERARPQLLQQRAIEQLEALGDGENLADAAGDLARCACRGADRREFWMDEALAVMPNRQGPASSCSSLAISRRSSSCTVMSWR